MAGFEMSHQMPQPVGHTFSLCLLAMNSLLPVGVRLADICNCVHSWLASAQRLQDLHAALTFAFPFLFYLTLGNLAGFYSVLFPVRWSEWTSSIVISTLGKLHACFWVKLWVMGFPFGCHCADIKRGGKMESVRACETFQDRNQFISMAHTKLWDILSICDVAQSGCSPLWLALNGSLCGKEWSLSIKPAMWLYHAP